MRQRQIQTVIDTKIQLTNYTKHRGKCKSVLQISEHGAQANVHAFTFHRHYDPTAAQPYSFRKSAKKEQQSSIQLSPLFILYCWDLS